MNAHQVSEYMIVPSKDFPNEEARFKPSQFVMESMEKPYI